MKEPTPDQVEIAGACALVNDAWEALDCLSGSETLKRAQGYLRSAVSLLRLLLPEEEKEDEPV